MLFSRQLSNGSHNFFQTFSIYFLNYFIKNPQTRNARAFLPLNISAVGTVNSTTIYDFRAVVDEAMHMHMWEDKGAEMLRVIQLNTLEDRSVHDKFQWDSAINFLQSSLQEKLEISEANLRYLLY